MWISSLVLTTARTHVSPAISFEALHGLADSQLADNIFLTDKTELQSVFSEDHPGLTLHSKELHREHCAVVQQNPALPSTFGVKKTCLLNSLQLFHTSDNYAIYCILHIYGIYSIYRA